MNRAKRLAAVVGATALTMTGAMAANVSAQEPAEPPVVPVDFSGQIGCGPEIRAGTIETTSIEDPADGPLVVRANRGFAWSPQIYSMTDSRMDGILYNSFDSNEFGPNTDLAYGTGTWRIVNDEGAWEGTFNGLRLDDGESWASTTYPMYGEGAYDGLVALVAWDYTRVGSGDCFWIVKGVIVEGDLPEAPEPAS